MIRRKLQNPVEFHAGDLSDITVGIDFGGTKSGHAFVATANTGYYDRLIGLMSRRYMAKDGQEYDSNDIDRLTLEFISEVQKKYGPVEYVYWDNAETVLGTGVKKAVGRMYPGIVVRPARKHRIKDRIDCAVRLIGAGRFFIHQTARRCQLRCRMRSITRTKFGWMMRGWMTEARTSIVWMRSSIPMSAT